jgi:L-fuculose-phosphate aldolase
MMTIESAKKAVLETVREMDRSGLTSGTAGNVSARTHAGEVVMTPTALAYDRMTTADLVVMDLDGLILSGSREPTTESSLHLCCLRRHSDIAAVVHSHAIHASMFAANHESIPSVIEEVDLYLGGPVNVAAYHQTGSKALGHAVAELLATRGAALLANHGLVTVAQTPGEALQMARLVERTAQIIWGARSMGEPKSLPDSATAHFSGMYRQRRAAAAQAAARRTVSN